MNSPYSFKKQTTHPINSTSQLLDWEEALDYLAKVKGHILRIEIFWKGRLDLASSVCLDDLWCITTNHKKAKQLVGSGSCPVSQLFRIQH